MKAKAPNRSTGHIDENDRYYPCVPTPFGMIPLVGVTMTTERERELFGKEVQTNERDLDAVPCA